MVSYWYPSNEDSIAYQEGVVKGLNEKIILGNTEADYPKKEAPPPRAKVVGPVKSPPERRKTTGN